MDNLQIQVWPTHWAGGTSSVQYRGRNVPWIDVIGPVHSGERLILSGSSQSDYDFAERVALCVNLLSRYSTKHLRELKDKKGKVSLKKIKDRKNKNRNRKRQAV